MLSSVKFNSLQGHPVILASDQYEKYFILFPSGTSTRAIEPCSLSTTCTKPPPEYQSQVPNDR